jgi:acyl transferase domain-containing protein/acyl carrier protein
MTETFSDSELRHWLVDYLITNIGCDPDEIDADASLADLGVGSRDAVVLAGELAELLGRPVSPVEFWQHPTINALVQHLTTPESETPADAADSADRSWIDEPIAVIGLGCRLPGDIHGPESFWQFICDGRSAIGEVPPDRWRPFDNGSPEVAAALSETTRWGSFLTEIDAFDAEFFEISPREAAKMDPQQRLLLEVAYEALEHAGIPADSLRRTQTGVFAGACLSEYGYLASSDLSQVDAWSGTGGALSIIANRLSYFFDFRGPSVTVDTACSSSLVAVHLACQSLRTGDSNLAIAAGVNLLLSPAITRSFDKVGAMSPTGQCQAFDAGADGFVHGEGCGVAVLKRLTDALRDGDRVLAVVRGSAVNQDGRSNGLMAPNPAAQMAVLRAAYANAGVEPRQVDYVEANGTGSLLGDPIEARALGTVLGRARPPSAPLLIGAVKSNIGHLDAAAGMAGFIKTVLAVQRGHIPPNLHFQTPNPHIPFEDLRLKVVAQPTDWPSVDRARRAGVSAFGFGGTNAHVVLEAGPVLKAVACQPEPVTTLVLSGKTDERIASTAGVLAEWMTSAGAEVGLGEVAHTLNHHRSRQAKFATVAACDRNQAVAGLRALAGSHPAPGVVGPHQGACRAGTVFVYSDQGSQWAGMGKQLLADEPAFAAAVDDLEPTFAEQTGFSLQQVLAAGEPLVGIERIQPVLVGMQLALTALWRSHGVQPDAVIGHSMGEVSAAVVAGALSPADGLRVIATRSRLLSRSSGHGAMALLEVNDPVLPEFRTALADLTPKPPSIPIITMTSDDQTGAAPVFDADYWAANLCNPVRFDQAVTAAGADYGTFVEVSPNPLLTGAISDTLGQVHHHSIGTLQRDTHDTLTFHTNLNATHTTQPPLAPHPPEPHPFIPSTPWHHTHHWITLPEAPELGRRNGIPVDIAAGPQNADGVPDDWFYELTWPILESRAADAAATGSWLVVGDAPETDRVGVELEQVLGAASRVAVMSPSVLEESGDNAARFNARVGGEGTENVLYAPFVPRDHLDIASAYRLFNELSRLATTLAEVASTSTRPPKLFVVTRNAQPVGEGDRANPAHGLLWGLGRTLAMEHPEIWGSLIDVDDTAPPELIVRYVLAESQAADGENQVVYHAGLRRVPRLERRSRPTVVAAPLQGDGSHLVIEATGSVEPSLIRQLSDMGASTIVAVSRDAGSRLGDLAATLAPTGTKLIEVAADAADEAAMTGLFQRFGADLPPLNGIYLAPLAGRPVLLDATTDDEVNTVFGPELAVVSVLHKLSLKTPVHRFVLFSSITGVIGSTRRARYTATSAFLDTFAYARRALGLAATVVDWGLLKSLGDKQSETTHAGLQLMPAEVAIRALPAVLSPGSGVRCAVVAADWGQLTATDRLRGSLRVVADLVVDDNLDETAEYHTGAAPGSSGADELPAKWDWSQIPAENKLSTLEIRLRDILARELGMPASAVDMDRPFPELGLDSRVAMTVLREARELVGFDMSATMLWNHPTISSLAAAIVELLAPQPVPQQDDVDATLDSAGSVLDELFDSVESATAGSESGI